MLNDLFFRPYTAKELSAKGWLLRQLTIQADGLSGNLDKVWPDIRDSKWIGGDQEGWERVPYWLDGFIPLAWLLDNEDMKKRAAKYVDATLERQQEDGWICPCEDDERSRYDVWAVFLICKVLVVYYDCTEDDRIESAVYRALKNLALHLDRNTLFNWSATRWYECLIPLFWLYERKPEEWMTDLAHRLCEQGTDYEQTFENWRYQNPQERGRWNFMTHVVNMAMMLKSRALFSRVSGEDPNRFAKKAIRTLVRDHGMAVEHFTGDECLSGTSPIQGSECCSVTEAMYSYEWLVSITGDAEWSDRLEKAAFNALPATISPDMWTHQYDQMTNQVQCSRLTEETKPFRTNDGDAHNFGLEPNFGCCTANFNQGWPKFALSTMMKAKDGIAITAIAPSLLKTTYNEIPVEIEIITNYPFDSQYSVSVKTQAPVAFILYVRVPSSAETVRINGEAGKPGFHPVKRVWSGEETVEVSFSFVPEYKAQPDGMYALWCGPLLYSVPIKERWETREYTKNGVERKFPYCDYEIFPESKWNYAFAGDDFRLASHGIGDFPFSPETPPVSLTVPMAEIKWELENGVCQEKPKSTVPISEIQQIKMIPYGCTNLRMTQMPKIEISD